MELSELASSDTHQRMGDIRTRIRSWLSGRSWINDGFASDDDAGCVIGFSDERDTSYCWDGRQRPRLHRDPVCLVQWTLAGWGMFHHDATDDATSAQVVPVGQAFCTFIPSPHRYWLPPASPVWSVAWMVFHHPYAVERIARVLPPGGAVITPATDLNLGNALLRVFASLATHRGRHERECALIALGLELDRHGQHGNNERDLLLRRMRAMIEADTSQPSSIDAIAARFGQSRTQFTRHFTATTGVTPARFASSLRIERARQLLMSTQMPIADIAKQCGFQDPSHFARAFRRWCGKHPRAIRTGG